MYLALAVERQQMTLFLIGRLPDHTIQINAICWPTATAIENSCCLFLQTLSLPNLHFPSDTYFGSTEFACETILGDPTKLEWVGDELCDDDTNIIECNFDGGDCCGTILNHGYRYSLVKIK